MSLRLLLSVLFFASMAFPVQADESISVEKIVQRISDECDKLTDIENYNGSLAMQAVSNYNDFLKDFLQTVILTLDMSKLYDAK